MAHARDMGLVDGRGVPIALGADNPDHEGLMVMYRDPLGQNYRFREWLKSQFPDFVVSGPALEKPHQARVMDTVWNKIIPDALDRGMSFKQVFYGIRTCPDEAIKAQLTLRACEYVPPEWRSDVEQKIAHAQPA